MKNKIENIINKYLAGNVDQLEKDVLDSWANESQANLDELFKLKDIKDSMEAIRNLEDVNTDKALENINTNKGLFNNKIFWAVCIVLLLLGALLFNYSEKPESKSREYFAGLEVMNGTLEDKSVFHLGNNSRYEELSYRTTKLRGYAKLEVAKDPSKEFTVELVNGKITVLGTVFTMFSQGSEEEIFVEEGRVRYSYQNISTIINAGEYVKLINGDIVKTKSPPESMKNWNSINLKYVNHSFVNLIRDLEKRFAVDIDYSDLEKMSKQWTVTADFTNQNLDEILNELNLIFEITSSYEADKAKIVLSK